MRASVLVGASAVLCAMLRSTQDPESTGVDDDDIGEDAISYIQRFASKVAVNASVTNDGPSMRFYKAGEESSIPRPGKDYPEALRGVIWLDEGGFYGQSDLGAPETGGVDGSPLLVSFAGSLDKEKRYASIKGYGPTWTWANNKLAYDVWRQLLWLDFSYDFQFNEDYSVAQVYPTVNWGGWKSSVWKWFVTFEMVRQTPAEGECPPKRGASHVEVNRCATWIRRSWAAWNPMQWLTYPVFSVLDEDGAPIAGPHDAYTASLAVLPNHAPDVSAAKKYLKNYAGDPEKSSWFVGTGRGSDSQHTPDHAPDRQVVQQRAEALQHTMKSIF